jgi:MFS family permease
MDDLRRSRIAVTAAFVTHGAAAGSWAARVPWAQDRLGLSPGVLGLALLMPAVGSVTALPISGRLVARRGSRAATRIGLLGLCATVGLLVAVPRLPWLICALFCYGVAGGLTDVAMNANGVAVEARRGRPTMSGLHACWSLGLLLGGAVGGGVARAGIGAPTHLGVSAVALMIVGAVTTRRLLDSGSTDVEAAHFARPSRDVLLLGVLCAAAMFAEGAANEWSAVYAHRVDRVDPGTAASAFTAFALAMVAGRLVGDRVTAAFGRVRVLRVAGVLGAGGGAVVATVHRLPATAAGLALLGLGLAVAVPLAFGAAGHHGGDRAGHTIAAVATMGYVGWLAAPAVVGGVAQATSLPVSFGIVAAVTLTLTATAGAARVTPAPAVPASAVF